MQTIDGVVRRAPVPRARWGQALVEFAIIAPVLVLLLMCIIDGALLMFSHVSADFSVGDAARTAALAGNAANADSLTVQVVRSSAIGQTRLATVNEVDIYRLVQDPSSGALSVDSNHVNHYRLDGTAIGNVNWPSVTRDVSSTSGDLLGVTVIYTYRWQSGVLGPILSPQLKATYYLRLEPQVN